MWLNHGTSFRFYSKNPVSASNGSKLSVRFSIYYFISFFNAIFMSLFFICKIACFLSKDSTGTTVENLWRLMGLKNFYPFCKSPRHSKSVICLAIRKGQNESILIIHKNEQLWHKAKGGSELRLVIIVRPS